MRRHISGLEAKKMAIESASRGRVQIEPLPAGSACNAPSTTTVSTGELAASTGKAPLKRVTGLVVTRYRSEAKTRERFMAPMRTFFWRGFASARSVVPTKRADHAILCS